jgi:cystathionine beta-lyase/cystathionine gamma-synthase
MGIDISMQTATKYISGHRDTRGGVLSGSAAVWKTFESEYLCVGSGIQPFNAWLLLRGLRTLPLRLERIAGSTRQVLDFLKGHPLVEEVIFPLDPGFPQYELARRQMGGASGLISFFVKMDTVDSIEHFCNSLRHIRMALRGGMNPDHSMLRDKKTGLPAGGKTHRMLRLYVGWRKGLSSATWPRTASRG